MYDIYLQNPSFTTINLQKRKSPSAKAKGLEISRLPLVDSFRTFCWGEVIEELRNAYKLKELIGIPASTMNPI